MTTLNGQLTSTFFGGYKAVVRPDPIPNSAVKRSVADGSACIACARVGRRQIFVQRRKETSGVFVLSTRRPPSGETRATIRRQTAAKRIEFVPANDSDTLISGVVG